eukprot:scaffold1602_cov151-Amphora_coffeaeformis.AAC.4
MATCSADKSGWGWLGNSRRVCPAAGQSLWFLVAGQYGAPAARASTNKTGKDTTVRSDTKKDKKEKDIVEVRNNYGTWYGTPKLLSGWQAGCQKDAKRKNLLLRFLHRIHFLARFVRLHRE